MTHPRPTKEELERWKKVCIVHLDIIIYRHFLRALGEIEKLKDERNIAIENAEGYRDEVGGYEELLHDSHSREEMQTLRAKCYDALEKYGTHDSAVCVADKGGACSCGLQFALKEMGEWY